MIKVKVKPDDFIVEEIADVPMSSTGDFCVYLLKKRGWNTVDILKNLSRKLNLPSSDFSYGGKKDKYALTSQYITIGRQGYKQTTPSAPASSQGGGEGRIKKSWIMRKDVQSPSAVNSAEIKRLIPMKLDKENYSLSFVGLMDRPMGPDLIKGNKFHIVVRNLTGHELKSALNEIECVKKDGYSNYFDDQRFGRFEKEAFSYLEKHPKGFVPVLQRISHEEMVLFFSAYQSHLWNEVLRKIIRSVVNHDVMYGNFQYSSSPLMGEAKVGVKGKGCSPSLCPSHQGRDYSNMSSRRRQSNLKISKGLAGDYLFYTHLDNKDKEYLCSLVIPMPASNIRMPDTFTETLYSEVLKENDITSPMFNMRKIRQAFFKGIERKAVVIPEELFFDYSEDEIYQGKKKLVLDFFLPRGCFGTIFIKRIFS